MKLLTRTACLAAALSFSLGRAAAPEPAPAPDAEMNALHEHARHHQHGGISQFVEMSIDTLGEDEANEAQVEKIQDQLHACTEPVEEAEQKVLETIADGVAAGTVDPKKTDAAVAALTTSAGAIHGCVAGPLNQLHQVLGAPQRAELVEKVRAHWRVWRHVKADLPLDSRDPAGALMSAGKELSLKSEQVDQAVAPLKAVKVPDLDVTAVEGQIDSFAKAFVGNTFDATTVTTASTSHLSAYGAARTAAFYQALTPVLTAEQRTALAAHLREHASHHQKLSEK